MATPVKLVCVVGYVPEAEALDKQGDYTAEVANQRGHGAYSLLAVMVEVHSSPQPCQPLRACGIRFAYGFVAHR